MQFKVVCLLALVVAIASAAEEKEHRPEHVERGHEEHRRLEDKEKQPKSEERLSSEKKGQFKLDEKTKNILVNEKIDKPEFVVQKVLEFFLKNPSRQFERQCFAKFNPGESVDFVIDIAPSPASDKLDKILAESPLAYYLDLKHEAVSPAYFNSIQKFIEAVTFDMKPEATHSIIYESGRKYIIRGKAVDAPITMALSGARGEFSDSKRNLKTMWPVSTNSVSQQSFLHAVLKNNLGRMTKLALWNRDNGLPTVLASSRRSKPIYTIVITDGASGAKIDDLVDDVTRTTVIDIGDRRFVKTLDWEDMRRFVNVVTLNAPQQLVAMVDTCRLMACRACGC